MKKLLMTAAAMVLVPLCSSAATFQINVTGDLEYALTGSFQAYDGNVLNTYLGLVRMDDPTSPFYSPSLVDYSGLGSVIIETREDGSDRASNCSGILSYLCWRYVTNEFNEASGGILAINYPSGSGRLELGPFTPGSVGSFSFATDYNLYGYNSGIFDFDGAFYGFSGGEVFYRGEYDGMVYGGPTQAIWESYNLTSYQITAIPLPAALPLLAAGLGGLGFIGRRKKKAA